MQHPPRAILYSQVVDLSRELHPGMPVWPGDPPLRLRAAARLEREGYYLRRVSLGEHAGTHLSAPRAFYADGEGVEAYAPEDLVAPAVVMDLRSRVAADPDYACPEGDVLVWEEAHGPVPAGSVVLALTGWGELWDDPDRYLGRGEGPGLHFPGFSLEAARFLLEERGVAGLGIDTPGVDAGRDAGFSVSRLLLRRPRLVLANLARLEGLPATGASLVVGILRLRGGSGSPASVLALVP